MNGFPLIAGDALRVHFTHCRTGGFGARIVAIVLTPDGHQALTTLNLNQLVPATFHIVPLPAGLLLSVCVLNLDPCDTIEYHVQVELRRDSIGVNPPVVTFISSWVGGGESTSWISESGVVLGRLRGVHRSYGFPAPGAGLDWVANEDFDGTWTVEVIQLTFSCSAAAANRWLSLEAFDALGNPYYCRAPAVQTANQTVLYTMTRGGINLVNAGQWMTMPLPRIEVDLTFWMGTRIANLQVGDVINEIYASMVPSR